jgi:N-acetylglucosamine-6-phosphate deacetylase
MRFIPVYYIQVRHPDVIDVHTHGTGSFDTRAGSASEILGMAGLYGQAGVTAVLPTIYPAAMDEMRRNMSAVVEAMEEQGTPGEGVAEILGIHLEGPFLSPERAGALDPGSFLKPTKHNLSDVLMDFREAIKVITVAPELDGALDVIERCAESGIRVSMGHSDATYGQALEGKRAGATCVTHLFNAMRPFHHREPGLAGFGLLDEDIYVEVIPDGVHLAPEIVEMVFRVKPLDKIIFISDSIKGPIYKKGLLQGSNIMLTSAAEKLSNTGIGPDMVRRACSDNPIAYLGL